MKRPVYATFAIMTAVVFVSLVEKYGLLGAVVEVVGTILFVGMVYLLASVFLPDKEDGK